MTQAILFSQMEPPADLEREFNAWYDEEHVPLRLAVSGFLAAVRYRVHPEAPDPGEAPRYAVTYRLRDLHALTSEAYRRVKERPSERTGRMLRAVTKLTRYACAEISQITQPGTPALEEIPVLYPVWFSVPEHAVADFEAWYGEEHIPLLMEEPRWFAAARYRITDGEPARWTHLTLHYLESADALLSPARTRARATPWRKRLAAEPWFRGASALYERIAPPKAWGESAGARSAASRPPR